MTNDAVVTKLAKRFGGQVQADGSYLFCASPAATRVGGPYTALLRFCSAAERLGVATKFGGLRVVLL